MTGRNFERVSHQREVYRDKATRRVTDRDVTTRSAVPHAEDRSVDLPENTVSAGPCLWCAQGFKGCFRHPELSVTRLVEGV